MAKYEINTNDAEEAGLTHATSLRNAELEARTPPEPTLDNQGYLDFVVHSALESYAKQASVNTAEQVKTKMDALDEAAKAKVNTVLDTEYAKVVAAQEKAEADAAVAEASAVANAGEKK